MENCTCSTCSTLAEKYAIHKSNNFFWQIKYLTETVCSATPAYWSELTLIGEEIYGKSVFK